MLHHNLPGQIIDVDALIGELENAGEEWADAKSAADALEDAKKSVYSQALLNVDGKTVGEREARAYCDPHYMSHIKHLADARRRSNRARVRYDVLQVKIELIRSNVSTQRAAMQLR